MKPKHLETTDTIVVRAASEGGYIVEAILDSDVTLAGACSDRDELLQYLDGVVAPLSATADGFMVLA